MTRDKHTTPVLFRATRGRDPEICALFPMEPATLESDGWLVTCFAVMGGHGAADPRYIDRTRPATPKEYAETARVLRGYGYRVKVYKRTPRNARKVRAAEVARMRAAAKAEAAS